VEPRQPHEKRQSSDSFWRLAGVVIIAAIVTAALTIDWVRVLSEFAGAPVDAGANVAAAPGKASRADRPIAVKTIAIMPAQPRETEARNDTDFAAAKAQLARELMPPETEMTGAGKPRIQEASVNPSPRVAEDANSGAAPSDRGHSSEPRSSSRAFDTSEAQQLIRRAEQLLASGDIAAARLILQRMAEANEQRAALLLASTYDPLVLEKLRVYAFAADVPKARSWYEKAREMGSPEASHRLELLAQLVR
jgi:hypothetical protein